MGHLAVEPDIFLRSRQVQTELKRLEVNIGLTFINKTYLASGIFRCFCMNALVSHYGTLREDEHLKNIWSSPKKINVKGVGLPCEATALYAAMLFSVTLLPSPSLSFSLSVSLSQTLRQKEVKQKARQKASCQTVPRLPLSVCPPVLFLFCVALCRLAADAHVWLGGT